MHIAAVIFHVNEIDVNIGPFEFSTVIFVCSKRKGQIFLTLRAARITQTRCIGTLDKLMPVRIVK